MYYSAPAREEDPHALPDVEVFYIDARKARQNTKLAALDRGGDALQEEGWYWWLCFPGCLPDSEPDGPYASEADALAAAQEEAQ